MVYLPTVQSFKYLGSTINRGGGASEDVENRVTKAWSKLARTEWSDLQQENSNKIEAPDISDSDLIDFALRMRNMANVSQI